LVGGDTVRLLKSGVRYWAGTPTAALPEAAPSNDESLTNPKAPVFKHGAWPILNFARPVAQVRERVVRANLGRANLGRANLGRANLG
jgi:hypothetical protein